MKWFKHMSDTHRGRSMQFLLDNMGHKGLCYYFLVEMCAEKLEKNSTGNVTKDDCEFYFHMRVMTSALRLSVAGVTSLLRHCEELGLCESSRNGEEIKIKMPMLLELLEKNFKKRAKLVPKYPRNSPLDIDIDKDIDKELEKEKDSKLYRVSHIEKRKKSVSSDDKNSEKKLGSQIWESYQEAYRKRYNVTPTRNSKTNSICKSLGDRIGSDAVDVVRFYLTHNDSWYLKRQHDLGSLLSNAEGMHTQWKRNKTVTSVDVRNFERLSETDALLEKINRGEV